MKQTIIDRVTKLFSVKSIVTIVMTAVLAVLLLSERVPDERILSLFSTAYVATITYFFTRKDDKNV